MKGVTNRRRLLAVAAIISVAVLCGCNAVGEGSEALPAYTVDVPQPIDTGSNYPGGTFNETNLVFIEEIMSDDVVTVSSSQDGGTYTISRDVNKEQFGDQCEHYLSSDVMNSIADDWQVETWEFLLDNVRFKSIQPQITFTDSTGKRWVRFWLDSKFAAVFNNSGGITFKISDEVVEAVKAQYSELPTRTSSRRTPEETVELFLKRLNDDDAEGMNEMLAKPLEKLEFYPAKIKDKIVESYNLGHIGGFPAQWYENPYSNRVVVVQFERTVTKKTGLFKSETTSGKLTWDFYLIRAAAQDEWKVAAYGAS
ncbi:MAG: hypothetical protein RR998_09135 [Oscillospiraceae bacterium]